MSFGPQISMWSPNEDDDDDTARLNTRSDWLEVLQHQITYDKMDLLKQAKLASDIAKKLVQRARRATKDEFYKLITERLESGGTAFYTNSPGTRPSRFSMSETMTGTPTTRQIIYLEPHRRNGLHSGK